MAAKRKTAKRKTTAPRRRNSRVGGIGSKNGFSNALPLIAGLALGAVGSAASDKLLAKMNLNAKLQGGIKIVAGLYLSGGNSPLLRGVGLGMASAGTITIAHSFGLLQNLTAALSGMEDYSIEGIRQDAYVNGIDYGSYVNGLPQEDTLSTPSNYADNGCARSDYGMSPIGA